MLKHLLLHKAALPSPRLHTTLLPMQAPEGVTGGSNLRGSLPGQRTQRGKTGAATRLARRQGPQPPAPPNAGPREGCPGAREGGDTPGPGQSRSALARGLTWVLATSAAGQRNSGSYSPRSAQRPHVSPLTRGRGPIEASGKRGQGKEEGKEEKKALQRRRAEVTSREGAESPEAGAVSVATRGSRPQPAQCPRWRGREDSRLFRLVACVTATSFLLLK